MVPVGESEKILTQLKAYARALALETGSKATWAAGSLHTSVSGVGRFHHFDKQLSTCTGTLIFFTTTSAAV